MKVPFLIRLMMDIISWWLKRKVKWIEFTGNLVQIHDSFVTIRMSSADFSSALDKMYVDNVTKKQ